jgi:hypothetical protein
MPNRLRSKSRLPLLAALLKIRNLIQALIGALAPPSEPLSWHVESAFAQRQILRVVFKGASYSSSGVPSCTRCTKLAGLVRW